MTSRKKLRGKTKEYFEEVDKGRKKPWQPRGGMIPPNVVHISRDSYKRIKFDWRELAEENPDEN
jgi:hypothetical protein